jgi:DNA replication regulator DPB11
VASRTEINRLVTQNGGKYVKALERPVRVTHLLCAGDQETDKMKYARKFNQRGEANIKIVWQEWFHDCLEYGGACVMIPIWLHCSSTFTGQFDEKPYLVENPRPEPRIFTQLPAAPALDPAPRPMLPDPAPVPEPTTVDEDEIASARRVPAVTLRVWESLLKPRGFVREGGKLVRTGADSAAQAGKAATTAPKTSQAAPVSLSQRAVVLEPMIPGRKGHSALSSYSRTNSFASARPEAELSKQPFRRAASLMSTVRDSPAPEVAPAAVAPVPAASPKTGIFFGMRFRARGEARSATVREAVEERGGVWVGDDESDIDFILVRLVRFAHLASAVYSDHSRPLSGSTLYRAELDDAERAKYRTECWMEACLARTRLCAPDEHVSFIPLGIALPIPGANAIVLSPSGLDIAEDTWVKRLARALGLPIPSPTAHQFLLTHRLRSTARADV